MLNGKINWKKKRYICCKQCLHDQFVCFLICKISVGRTTPSVGHAFELHSPGSAKPSKLSTYRSLVVSHTAARIATEHTSPLTITLQSSLGWFFLFLHSFNVFVIDYYKNKLNYHSKSSTISSTEKHSNIVYHCFSAPGIRQITRQTFSRALHCIHHERRFD